MEKRKAELETTAQLSKGVAGIDLLAATFAAAKGNGHFAYFMILAGLMYTYGVWIQSKADGIEGE